MYQSFSEYKQLRETHDLNFKVNILCEAIVKSGKSYDEWWLEQGMPIILEQAYADEDELLMEFMGRMGQWMGDKVGAATQGLQNFGRGVAQGWRQGRDRIPVWDGGSGGMHPNAQQAPPQGGGGAGGGAGGDESAAGGGTGGAGSPLMGQIQQVQQQFISSLRSLLQQAQAANDTAALEALRNLIAASRQVGQVNLGPRVGQNQVANPQAQSNSGGNVEAGRGLQPVG
jgi:hypothetical protein